MCQTGQLQVVQCHLKQPQQVDWGFEYSTFIAAPSAVSDRFHMASRRLP